MEPIKPTYRFRAYAERVIDGDTYCLRVDLGFHVAVSISARLYGVDCPERGSREGDEATAFVRELLRPANLRWDTGPREPTPLVIETHRDTRSFARWVVEVFYEDGSGAMRSLAATLVDEGHAEVSL